MLAEMIDKIVGLKETKTFEIGGEVYSDAPLSLIEKKKNRPESISVNSLDSICNLIKSEHILFTSKLLIRVAQYNKVEVMTSLEDEVFSRNWLYEATADTPRIFNGFKDREQAIIEIRSLYIPNSDTEYLLNLISRMKNENSVGSDDNGITQKIEVKQGIALNEKVAIKPRVKLQPFRTFLEVEQPESEFLLRVNKEGEIGLFEADGGVWKLEAKKNIAEYFENELSDLIRTGKVIVMK